MIKMPFVLTTQEYDRYRLMPSLPEETQHVALPRALVELVKNLTRPVLPFEFIYHRQENRLEIRSRRLLPDNYALWSQLVCEPAQAELLILACWIYGLLDEPQPAEFARHRALFRELLPDRTLPSLSGFRQGGQASHEVSMWLALAGYSNLNHANLLWPLTTEERCDVVLMHLNEEMELPEAAELAYATGSHYR